MVDNDYYKKLKHRLYYRQNLEYTNNLVSLIIFAASLLGIGFALGTFFSIFSISYFHSILLLMIGVFFSFTQYIFNKIEKLRETVKYMGFVFTSFFISLASIIPGVGLSIYFAFILVPFVSTLYLDIKLSSITSLITYFLMAISLYINSHYNFVFHSPAKIDPNIFIGEFFGYSAAYIFVAIIALAVSNTFRKTISLELEKQAKIKELKLNLIETFAHIVEWSDKYTGQHIQRTSKYVEIISNKLVEMNKYTTELTPETINLYVSAAPLHDIGKINVPNNILSKPGKFTDEEYEIMKTHSLTGYNIIMTDLSQFEDAPYIRTASQMALYHHERWDGTGYPNKAKGTNIPLCGRIMAAADVLDALLSKRQYKEPYTIEQTFDVFKNQKNKQFEPCIVDAVLDLKEDILKIVNEE